MIRYFAVAVGTFIAISAQAQPDLRWSQTYGGDSSDVCLSVIQTADGGFALAGFTESFGEGDRDFWLVVTDEEGEELWSQTYGGGADDYCHSIIQTADGGFALAGETESFGEGGPDMWLVRTDNEGEELWSQTYGGWNIESCYSIIQTPDGGFALAGETWSFGEGMFDFWLVRTDDEGEELWSQTYGGGVYDWCTSVIQTADGGFALAGTSNSFGDGGYDFWLVRTDERGGELWSQTYGGDSTEFCETVIQSPDGGFALTGNTASFGEGGHDFWLVRTDDEGEELWSQTYGGEEDDRCYSNILTDDVGYALAGRTMSFGEGEGDFWLVRTEPDPVSVPSKSFILHPLSFILLPAYPNPFNSTTSISFGLPSRSALRITVLDTYGRTIAMLAEHTYAAGFHSIVWDATGFPTGIYLVRLEDGNVSRSVKMTLIR